MKQIQSSSDMKVKILAIGLEEDATTIAETYYAEDLDVLLNGILELNKFLENLKKSVAPMAGLGAVK